MEAEVLVRKYEQKDRGKLAKLEKQCRTRSVDGVTLSEKMLDDPLCRIKCYPVHVMHVYPMDGDMILKEKLSLGTWICYFREDERVNNVTRDKCEDFWSRTRGSWIVFSIWNTCESYLLQFEEVFPSNRRHKLCLADRRALSCLKLQMTRAAEEHFGFLLMCSLHGEGPRLGELMRSVWKFAEKVARAIKHCKGITTELASTDPLREHLPLDSCTTCIDDLWCLKYLGDDSSGETDNPTIEGPMGNVFVDPRDF